MLCVSFYYICHVNIPIVHLLNTYIYANIASQFFFSLKTTVFYPHISTPSVISQSWLFHLGVLQLFLLSGIPAHSVQNQTIAVHLHKVYQNQNHGVQAQTCFQNQLLIYYSAIEISFKCEISPTPQNC